MESFDDHRVAMSLACLGLGLPEGQEVIVNDAECCSVSFPGFFDVMNKIFFVANAAKESFDSGYPGYSDKLQVIKNTVDIDSILEKAKEPDS